MDGRTATARGSIVASATAFRIARSAALRIAGSAAFGIARSAAIVFAVGLVSVTTVGCTSPPDPNGSAIDGGAIDGGAIDVGAITDGAITAEAVETHALTGTVGTQRATDSGHQTPDLAPDASAEALRPRRLTDPGCCPMPFWSPDSQSVLFFLDPNGDDDETGLYAVPVGGGTPTFVGGAPLGTQLAGQFITRVDGDLVELTRASDGRVWSIDTDGAMLTVSADGRSAAWVEGLSDTVPGQRPPPGINKVMDLETGDARTVELPDGYLLGDWTADGRWILTRQDRESDLPMLVRFDPTSGETSDLFDGARLRTGRTSPSRMWLAISRTFEDEPGDNGLFVLAMDGRTAPRRLDLAGGYYWRDDDRLLVVPQEPGADSMTLWQVDAATGAAEALTDPAVTPFRIAAGEWSVSPDGTHVAYRSSDDDAIWVMRLPE